MDRLKKEFLWFCVAGTIGFVVDVSVLLAAVGPFEMGAYRGRVVSFVAAASATWLVNRLVTFARHRARGSKRSVIGEWGRYLLAMTPGGALNFAAYSAVVGAFGMQRPVLVAGVVIGTAVGLAFNFVASRHWVFAAHD